MVKGTEVWEAGFLDERVYGVPVGLGVGRGRSREDGGGSGESGKDAPEHHRGLCGRLKKVELLRGLLARRLFYDIAGVDVALFSHSCGIGGAGRDVGRRGRVAALASVKR